MGEKETKQRLKELKLLASVNQGQFLARLAYNLCSPLPVTNNTSLKGKKKPRLFFYSSLSASGHQMWVFFPIGTDSLAPARFLAIRFSSDPLWWEFMSDSTACGLSSARESPLPMLIISPRLSPVLPTDWL